MADRKNIQKADRVKKAENGQKRLNSPGSKLTQGNRSEMLAVAKQDFATRVGKCRYK